MGDACTHAHASQGSSSGGSQAHARMHAYICIYILGVEQMDDTNACTHVQLRTHMHFGNSSGG